MTGRREHPAGRPVPAWALAGLRPPAPQPPKHVRGQTDIFDVLDQAAPELRADGQLAGQTDIFDVLDSADEAGGTGRPPNEQDRPRKAGPVTIDAPPVTTPKSYGDGT